MTLVLYSLFFPYDWPILFAQWVFDMIKNLGLFPIQYKDTENEVKPVTVLPKSKNSKKKKEKSKRLTWRQCFILLLFTFYFASQVIIPSLHLLHKHSATWEGQTYFGWRMMMVCILYALFSFVLCILMFYR